MADSSKDDNNTPEPWEPWQFARFDAPAAASARPAATPRKTATDAKVAAVNATTAAELERLRQEARDSGHAEGYAAGLIEGKKQARSEAQRLATLVGQLDAALEAFDQQMAEEVLALSLAVARQVIHQHLSVHPESLLITLRELLAQLHHPQVLISVHPDDASLLRSYLDEQPGYAGRRLHEDPRMQRGGCIIEAGGGQIDASIETRWTRVVESLGSHFSWLGEEALPAATNPHHDADLGPEDDARSDGD